MKIVIGIIVALVIIGLIFMPKKKNVGKKLDKAKQLFEQDEFVKINSMLDELIIFPISEKYTTEYAQSLIESLNFLKKVCKAQNISKDDLIDPILYELKKISSDGEKIDSSITEPLEKWIEEMVKGTEFQANTLIKDSASYNEMVENGKDEDFLNEELTREESDVINSVGKYLLKRKFNEGITFLDRQIPTEMSTFKANLLDQKAALYFMDGKINEAVKCYQEILRHYPDNYRIKTSLAEGYVQLKDIDNALKYAKEVVNFSRSSENQNTCRKIVKKYG